MDVHENASSFAVRTAEELLASSQEQNTWTGFVGRLVLFLLHTVSSILYWTVRLSTITIPTLLFSLLSSSLTVTMNFTTLALILAAVVAAASWVVRYRVLNMYSRLPPEPQRKEPDVDLFPGTHEEGAKYGLSSYLDEFLSAIKIFGYLERPVFHELTRSMQTRKLIAGETLNLEEEKGFCIVVDGQVDIFVKSGQRTQVGDILTDPHYESSGEDDSGLGNGHQKYQLLTEVRNGVPMSSLFSIMSLFTEGVNRVTLATAYNYLGLTEEVLHTEKSMIRYTSCQLPNALRGDPLNRLKEKFKRERERIGADEQDKGIALHNSASSHPPPSRSSANLRKEAVLQSMSVQRPVSQGRTTILSSREGRSPHSPSPGDLISNIQLARTGGRNISIATGFVPPPLTGVLRREATSPLAQRAFDPLDSSTSTRSPFTSGRDSVDEDNLFRVSVLECMFKSLGFGNAGSSMRETDSAQQSPRVSSFEQRGRHGTFSSSVDAGNDPFSLLGPMDESIDGDTESMASTSVALGAQPSAHALALDMTPEVEIVFFPKGSILIEQGERNPGLYYVIDGFLDLCATDDGSSIESSDSERRSFHTNPGRGSGTTRRDRTTDGNTKKGRRSRRSVALIKPGGLAGYIGSVSSYRSFIDVVAKTDVYVGFLPRAPLERIVDKYPVALLTMAKRLTDILPRLILHIDFALEWVQVNASQVLFRKDDESEAIYIVLNGRLRLVEDKKDGGIKVRDEFGQGESIGELEVLTESTRPGTLHAIRDTELVKFPRTLFNSLAQEHPNITIKISKIIASRMRSLFDDPSKFMLKDGGFTAFAASKGSSNVNLRTVAILPVTSGVPVVEFGNKLMNALAQVGPPNGATSLNQAAILNHLGRHAFNKMGGLKLSQYLADLEEKYNLVLYVADTNVNSPWTQTCISQADSILLVGLAEGSPEIGEYERFMLGMKSTARKTLVLLHPERFSAQGLTRAWLRNRVWINGGHYHVQMAFRLRAVQDHAPARRLGIAIKERVLTLQAEVQKYTSRKARQTPLYSPEASFKGDFHRLARRLCGKSVGLVLGGGGARGMAHIGVIMAMEEAGIPVDIIGGTSIGAFVGALYGRHADVVPIFGLAKKFAGRMASMWRFALDLTYPSVSYTTGHTFNRGIFKALGNTHMEDFWLEFYCNTTNISKSRAEFHRSGYAWRYIRASMSLAGLLPPLCDEGNMLLDGGYVDNLTVSYMKSLGAETIFAVDVGSVDDDTPQRFGDSLSGMWAVLNRWNPFSSHPNPPTLAEIQAKLAYVSSIDALEKAKAMPGCFYMRPPIDPYGTLDFGKFDEIYMTGYRYGTEYLAKLKEEGALPVVEETDAKKALRRTMAPRRASI
ncbi:related to serine esterase that deacylates exogenous lysophospholipids [Cephalotrichum gorgonifer]|uniref:Lysophospholipase NTE1 n=1 Tax=Cephalotrichum gorgonifer TaxID=2041049 RepID=A0AAE8MUR4_9PEZI|nr:related to serine esterase that deacylates exogenous lysophospholipids [Cephalotrichum gorgonifer]